MSAFVEFAAAPCRGISCAELVALAGRERAAATDDRLDGGLRRIGEILPLVLERYEIDQHDLSGAEQNAAQACEGLLGSGI